jgi:hypothetical protein
MQSQTNMTRQQSKNEGAPEFRSSTGSEDAIARITQLQHSLRLCPTDIVTRGELAALFEHGERYEEALFNWQAVLVYDPNNLKAREGLARCRQRIGPPLKSSF